MRNDPPADSCDEADALAPVVRTRAGVIAAKKTNAMLSLGKLAPGQQEYYLATVAAGAEEYYTGAKEAPGEWTGRSAARLGLVGEVDAETSHQVLEQRNPGTGARLTARRAAPMVPGFDATFCAPKSVSLLFALGEPEASNEVRNADDAAVAAAMRVFETEAACARRGRGGRERASRQKVSWRAAFRHRTSRAADPHLHTHVSIANLVYCEHDQRWSALDARGAVRMGQDGRLSVRGAAARRADAPPRRGLDAGAQRDCRHRRLLRGGAAGVLDPAPRDRDAPRRTRRDQSPAPRRSPPTPPEGQGRRDARGEPAGRLARACARALGSISRRLTSMLERCVVAESFRVREARRPSGCFDQLAAPTGLTARSASFGRREVLQAISAASPNGGDIDEILDLADAFLDSRACRRARPGRVADQ